MAGGVPNPEHPYRGCVPNFASEAIWAFFDQF
jgi:hypothetical protein